MYHLKPKSFKMRRLISKWKKFRLKTKSSAQEKFREYKKSFAKTGVGQKVQVLLGIAEGKVLEPPSLKVKPKPLKGVKVEYELLPLRKTKRSFHAKI